MRDFLSLKHILLFFLPLIFVTELHQISHTILHAFLARLTDPKLTLAAFGMFHGNGSGQTLALFALAVAAIEGTLLPVLIPASAREVPP